MGTGQPSIGPKGLSTPVPFPDGQEITPTLGVLDLLFVPRFVPSFLSDTVRYDRSTDDESQKDKSFMLMVCGSIET